MFANIPKSYFCRPSRPGPKVVSIPVQFLGSETTRIKSALKIQKIFRGFLVRKNIKKILAIGREVNEVERKIVRNLDSIRRNPKEKLRINEMLMSLLFKLDSVQSVGPGVRDCRKAVIKKAIALQEKIDSSDEPVNVTNGMLKMEGKESGGDVCGDGNRGLGNGDVIETDIALQEKFDGDDKSDTGVVEIVGEESGVDMECNDDASRNSYQGSRIEDETMLEKQIDYCDDTCTDVVENEGKASVICEESHDNGSGNCNQDIEDKVNGDDNGPESTQLIPDGSVQQLNCEKCVDSDDDYCIVKQVVVGEEGDSDTKPIAKQVHEDDFVGEAMVETLDDEAKPVKGENQREKELMERMIEENGKMMSMMKQLSEQNQAQTQMLSLLRQRVEHLEKAFVCEVSRKKTKDKKKRAANGITDGLDSYPDSKKCGKR